MPLMCYDFLDSVHHWVFVDFATSVLSSALSQAITVEM